MALRPHLTPYVHLVDDEDPYLEDNEDEHIDDAEKKMAEEEYERENNPGQNTVILQPQVLPDTSLQEHGYLSHDQRQASIEPGDQSPQQSARAAILSPQQPALPAPSGGFARRTSESFHGDPKRARFNNYNQNQKIGTAASPPGPKQEAKTNADPNEIPLVDAKKDFERSFYL